MNNTAPPPSAAATLLVGHGGDIQRVPAAAWAQKLAGAHTATARRFTFMTAAHRRVRDAAVLWLPKNRRQPLSVRQLSRATALPERDVDRILDELQRHLFFLVRNRRGDVAWAFPVTSDRTAHQLTFNSGERLWGA